MAGHRRVKEVMHLAVVACGNRLDETLAMVKSALLFSLKRIDLTFPFSSLRHPPHAYFDPNDFLEVMQQDIEREELEYEVNTDSPSPPPVSVSAQTAAHHLLHKQTRGRRRVSSPMED